MWEQDYRSSTVFLNTLSLLNKKKATPRSMDQGLEAEVDERGKRHRDRRTVVGLGKRAINGNSSDS